MQNYIITGGRSFGKTSAIRAFYKNTLVADGEGDGGSDDVTQSQAFKDAVSSAVNSAVNDATEGLKTKNDELLGKLTDATKKADQYKDVDLESYNKYVTNIAQSEEAQLIADGKIDEVLAKKLDGLKGSYEDKITALTEENTKNATAAQKYQSKFEGKLISDAIRSASVKLGIMPAAFEDVINRGANIFTISESGEVESRTADGALAKNSDGDILNPERFVESLKKDFSHYWPSSQSSQSRGTSIDGVNDKDNMGKLENVAQGKNGQFDLAQYRKERKAMSGDNYNKR